jgi:hypothetical protein
VPEAVAEKKIGKVIGKNYRLFFVNYFNTSVSRIE